MLINDLIAYSSNILWIEWHLPKKQRMTPLAIIAYSNNILWIEWHLPKKQRMTPLAFAFYHVRDMSSSP